MKSCSWLWGIGLPVYVAWVAALGEGALRGLDPRVRGVSETCSVQSQEQLGDLCTLTGLGCNLTDHANHI